MTGKRSLVFLPVGVGDEDEGDKEDGHAASVGVVRQTTSVHVVGDLPAETAGEE